MKIEDITPELAEKMYNAYLTSLIDLNIKSMSTKQKAISNGLIAIKDISKVQNRLSNPHLGFATYQLTNELEELENLLTECKTHLSEYLKSFEM